MQRERQEEIENEISMEENAGPLLINKLEVQRQHIISFSRRSLLKLSLYSQISGPMNFELMNLVYFNHVVHFLL